MKPHVLDVLAAACWIFGMVWLVVGLISFVTIRMREEQRAYDGCHGVVVRGVDHQLHCVMEVPE